MSDDYNLTAEELGILAPKQSVASGAFKGSVSLGATVFFAEKIIDKVFKTREMLPEKTGAYVLATALAAGAIYGAHSADKYNHKLKHFTDRLKESESKAAAAKEQSR